MSRLFSGLMSKLLVVFVIILFVAAFRELILTDDGLSDAFGELMEALPFSKEISEAVCRTMSYSKKLPDRTASSILSDLLKLAVMSVLQPFVVGFLSRLFLRIPGGTIDERESYMSGGRYRLRETVVTVLTIPLLAFVSARIVTWLSEYLSSRFGALSCALLGGAALIVVSGLALIPLLTAGLTVMTALIWHLLINLLGPMVTTLGIEVITLFLYLGLINGAEGQIAGSVISLIVWLIIMDFGLQCLRRAVVSK